MAKSKIVKANEKIADGVVKGYKKIEDGVVGGYKKIEEVVVGGFGKMTDKFVDQFLTQEGETVEDAKKRLADEQAACETAAKEASEQRHAENAVRMGAASDIAKASIEASMEMAKTSVEASKNAGKKL